MSSDTPSNIHSALRTSDRRVGFRQPISNVFLNEIATPEVITSPLGAAINLSSKYIATLHFGLTTFLTTFTNNCLKEYSVYFHNNTKHKEMRLGTTQLPTSVKRIRLSNRWMKLRRARTTKLSTPDLWQTPRHSKEDGRMNMPMSSTDGMTRYSFVASTFLSAHYLTRQQDYSLHSLAYNITPQMKQ